MAIIKFIATTQDRLKDLPIAAGQLIFATDKQTVYLDTNVRTAFEQIITVPTEQFRKSISSPVETASARRASACSSEPSIQTILSGFVIFAMSSIQSSMYLLSVRGLF